MKLCHILGETEVFFDAAPGVGSSPELSLGPTELPKGSWTPQTRIAPQTLPLGLISEGPCHPCLPSRFLSLLALRWWSWDQDAALQTPRDSLSREPGQEERGAEAPRIAGEWRLGETATRKTPPEAELRWIPKSSSKFVLPARLGLSSWVCPS